ncbi:MAG: response regulator transcription factor [Chloroflexi bacterium]|nr:response regulator transcription factor [Chloroflexota bacterium]
MEANPDKIRVLLVDDQETIHQEIGGLLSSFDNITLSAQARDGQQAVALCDAAAFDVVLMDISMPVMDGIAATRAILARHPGIRILAMSGIDDAVTVQRMLSAGAIGYILKDTHPEELESTIRTVHSGKSVLSADVMRPLLNRALASTKTPRDYGLTRREIDILQAMALGLNNSEVADRLYISVATVRFHLTNIIVKLGAENRTEALIIAVREKLI